MIIKPATSEEEFVQIHQLNYKTFVEEIPQHPQCEGKMLVDKFNLVNRYIIAKKNERLVGMVCYNCQRPFSIDQKLESLDQYLPSHGHLAEVRLLSVRAEERKATVAYRLLQHLCAELIAANIDMAVISGTTRQLRMYKRMGFTPFGPLVGKPGAYYQPMYITLNELRHDFRSC